MEKEMVITILKEQQALLRRQGVKSLAIFGSVARGEEMVGSDLDLLIEFDRPIGLFDFIRLKTDLEKIFGCPVDLVTPDALRPDLREQILGDAFDVR